MTAGEWRPLTVVLDLPGMNGPVRCTHWTVEIRTRELLVASMWDSGVPKEIVRLGEAA